MNGNVLALTPLQRWAAAREFNGNFMAERWFILIGVIIIVILTVLLFVVSFNRIRQQRKGSAMLFAEYAEKSGLTVAERQTLLNIANKAGLKKNESIFTLASAFDRGAAKMKESLVGQQRAEENKRLKTVLSCLREKLGFMKRLSYSKGTTSESLSSREIPVGKTVHMTRRKAQDNGGIEATIVKNSDTELAVRLAKPIEIIFGGSWCVRYYFGSSVWEFDTSAVSYDGDILVLKHSDNIRFINRRRFLRVPVKMPAFIARFPFEKSSIKNSHSSEAVPAVEPDFAGSSAAAWGPPEFVPAVVTELAGPGLRIESSLDVKTGERILIVFNLAQQQDSIRASEGKSPAGVQIVEDIGEVRRTEPTQNGLSIAVELTGLSDSNIDELIRATNAASLSVSDRNKNVLTLGNAVEPVPAHMSD
jgi:hypothetical protein